MSDLITQGRIGGNPNFQRLVNKRNAYSFIMIALVMICYYGYILLIAFNRDFLAQKLGAGMTTSIGVPMGVGVILFTIAVTWIYVRRANTEFDAEMESIVQEGRQ